ncbi:MAG: cytochrome c oxidase accessory protein CcoG [Phycisphaeraceae bacterium]|nr:cytochrome c oxidase accessory protein CcoG [Phycisphaeraceae bacterium]
MIPRPQPTPVPEPVERVLPTLNRDGSRRWLFPVLSPGRFLRRRRVVAWFLLILYNALPWISIGGKPAILLDLAAREFTFFGTTFLPTDTLLMMLFIAGVFMTIFLLTALLGRVWCGWACPQTVYMEFVYRPIERLFDGPPDARGRRGSRRTSLRTVLKYAVFALVSFHLAHTFLAYFVGPRTVIAWSFGSPAEHPFAFLLVLAVTGLMLFDFGFFREQTCVVACPYGRFQSVLLDRRSLIISYDRRRGEPRGPIRRRSDGDIALPQQGDCIDCGKCVVTCPTGIDIRDGLQMECIGCAQCIDACDDVMERVHRPRGLIRYSTQEAMEGRRRRLVRPRIIVYPAILLLITAFFLTLLINRPAANVTLLRASAHPYMVREDGRVACPIRVRIINRTQDDRTYSVLATTPADLEVIGGSSGLTLAAGAAGELAATVIAPRGLFVRGRTEVILTVVDHAGFARDLRTRLQGPWGDGTTRGAAAPSSPRRAAEAPPSPSPGEHP